MYVEDNWGNVEELRYDFNGKDRDEENKKEGG